jgi:chemotaxis protein MotB
MLRLFDKVLFKENSLELTPEAKKALEQVAEVIKELKGNYRVRIEGHTSRDEPTKPMEGIHDSWDLSILRATTVAKYLISKGVNPERLVAVGYDAVRPLYTWNNPILQARNRRVEIYIEVAVPKEEEKKTILKRKEELPQKRGEEGKD